MMILTTVTRMITIQVNPEWLPPARPSPEASESAGTELPGA